MQSSLVTVFCQNSEDTCPFEIKDPCVVPMPDGSYMMYATIFGEGIRDEDIIGRFQANTLEGPWKQLESAHVHGLTGPGVMLSEICAPQVILDEENGEKLWTMYVQTACFKEDGYIALAVSKDGKDFHAVPSPAVTRHSIPDHHVVALYDVSVSDIRLAGKDYKCMVFTGYRQFSAVTGVQDTLRPGIFSAITQKGSGDFYMTLREKNGIDKAWSTPKLIFKEEDIPFHNQPGSKNYEWGLEGGKIIQLEDNSFLLAGVCFLEKDLSQRGTRQRVFFATGASHEGPFLAQTLPFEPTQYSVGQGENGHPEVLDMGSHLSILYQERAGVGQPWHLRYAEIPKKEVHALFKPQSLELKVA